MFNFALTQRGYTRPLSSLKWPKLEIEIWNKIEVWIIYFNKTVIPRPTKHCTLLRKTIWCHLGISFLYLQFLLLGTEPEKTANISRTTGRITVKVAVDIHAPYAVIPKRFLWPYVDHRLIKISLWPQLLSNEVGS